MQRSEVLASIAIIVSGLSLAVNFWNAWRDRPQLLIQMSHNRDTLFVDIINCGRKSTAIDRPVHLKFFHGDSYPLMESVYYPNWPLGGKLAEATKLIVEYPLEDWKKLHRPHFGLPILMGVVVVEVGDKRHFQRLPLDVVDWLRDGTKGLER